MTGGCSIRVGKSVNKNQSGSVVIYSPGVRRGGELELAPVTLQSMAILLVLLMGLLFSVACSVVSAPTEDMMPEHEPRQFNMGFLDISASHCAVSGPNCETCPLLSFCSFTAKLGTIAGIPYIGGG